MKEYIMNIVGAVLVSVFAEAILPDKWNKYIKVITGLIIISTIISPLNKRQSFSIKGYEREMAEFNQEGELYAQKLVADELSKRLEEDIAARIKNDYSITVGVRTELSKNASGQIDAISKIELSGDNITDEIVTSLKKIYSPKEVLVNGF